MNYVKLQCAPKRDRSDYHRDRETAFVERCKAAQAKATPDPELMELSSGAACQMALKACEDSPARAAMWLAARGRLVSRQQVSFVKAGKWKGGTNAPTQNSWILEDGEFDEIAVSIAVSGSRSVRLTLREARAAAVVMLRRGLDQETVSEHLGCTLLSLRAWIDERRIVVAAPPPRGLEKRSTDLAYGVRV